MTASSVNCWADIAIQLAWLGPVGDTENFESQITGWQWAVPPSKAAQSWDKIDTHVYDDEIPSSL